MRKKILCTMLTLACLLGSSTITFAADNEKSLTPNSDPKQVQATLTENDVIVKPMSATGGVINADGVRVRRTPSTSGTVVGLFYKGDEVEIGDAIYTGSGYTWYYVINIRTGVSGYVVTQYVTEYPA